MSANQPDAVAEARDWLESWPGPLKLVGGSRAQQAVPDAHNAALDLVTRLVAEVERLQWQYKHSGDHVCDECWPEEKP